MATEKQGFEPVVYVKGDRSRFAYSPSDAVALEFDGYKRQVSEAAPEEPVVVDRPADEPQDKAAPTPSAVAKAAQQKKDNA